MRLDSASTEGETPINDSHHPEDGDGIGKILDGVG
jgi:hypothetical protein